MSERVSGEKMKEKLYELVKNMPKDEALRFIDTYKDNMKKRDTNDSLMERRNKVYTMKELVKEYFRKKDIK